MPGPFWKRAFCWLGQGPVFWPGVFQVPKNGGAENQKPLAMQVEKDASAYRKTSNVIINVGSPTALKTKTNY